MSDALASVRAACWALRAVTSARRGLTLDLRGSPIASPRVPAVPATAERGVTTALRLRGANCLVRATVLQTWHAAHGDVRDVVIGVTAPSAGFEAHAWLDGDPPCHSHGFEELTRRPVKQ